MMRIIVLLGIFLWVGLTNMQGQINIVPDGQTPFRLGTDVSSDITDELRDMKSTVTCSSCLYGTGRTLDILLNYNHISPDDEWTDGLYLVFPQGVTVNNATDITRDNHHLKWNGETGDGITVTWGDTLGGSKEGPLHTDVQFSVNITVDSSVTGAIEIFWVIIGDQWGSEPHRNSGSILLLEGGEKDILPVQLTTNFPNPASGTFFAHESIPVRLGIRVRNNGYATQSTYSISLTDGKDYFETVSADQDIGPGQVITTTFPCWTPAVSGMHILTAIVSLEGDEYPGNDTLRQNFNVFPFQQTGLPEAPRGIAEFESSQGAMVRARTSGGQAHFDVPYSLLAEIASEDILYIICRNQSEADIIATRLTEHSVNTDNVQYVFMPSNTQWTRDFGPWFIEYGDRNTGIINFPYNRNRISDNNVPTGMAVNLGIEFFGMPLVHTGGNYMTTGTGISASDDLTYYENICLPESEIHHITEAYMGIREYHFLPDPLRSWLQHIDTWAKFLAPDKIMILQLPENYSNHSTLEAMANYWSEQTSSYGTKYRVYRVFTPNGQAYTNSLILNDKLLLPVNPQYGTDCYDGAVQAFEEAMPGYRVIGIPYDFWYGMDALHCRVMQVPDLEMLRIVHQPYYDTINTGNGLIFEAGIYSLNPDGDMEESAFLYYSVNDGEFENIEMERNEGYNFSATVGGLNNENMICYYIEAMNKNNKKEYHPYTGKFDPHCFTVKSTTGIQPLELSSPMIFPNPFSDRLTIELASIGLPKTIKIADIFGRTVKNIATDRDIQRYVISMDDIPPGIYIAVIELDNRLITKKIVKTGSY
jgi:agmatine/peptidylarginine deiminase